MYGVIVSVVVSVVVLFFIACHQCCFPRPTQTSKSVINCDCECEYDEIEHWFELDLSKTGQEIQNLFHCSPRLIDHRFFGTLHLILLSDSLLFDSFRQDIDR